MSMSDQWQEAQAAVPASEPITDTIKLTLSADTPYTEIRLLDARFEPVVLSANTGRVEVEVAPGLYEAGFRTSAGWQSQHVLVERNHQDIQVDQDIAPLAQPVAVSPPQSFEDDSATVVVDLMLSGAGAGADPSGSLAPPDITVTLISAGDPNATAKDLKRASSSVWRFVAAPGYWRLRIDEAHPRQPFEIAVTALPSYVVYVTAPVRRTREGACVDLERFRFRLLQAGQLEPFSADLANFEEAALATLGRSGGLFGPALEELVDNLVSDKVANPMLGILAAHLCLEGGDRELQFQERLLAWLESLSAGQPPHPDVAALRLGHSMRNGRSLDGAAPILFPPLLAASWRILLDASRQRPGLIPMGSIGDQIADRLWASSQWLVWTSIASEAAVLPPVPPTIMVEAEMAEPAPPTRRVTVTIADDDPVGGTMAPTTGKRAVARKIVKARRRSPARAVVESSASPTAETLSNELSRTPSANTAVIETGLSHPELREWLRSAVGEPVADADQDLKPSVTPAEAAIASAVYPVAPDEKLQSMLQQFSESLLGPDLASKLGAALDRADALGLPRSTIERSLDSFANKLVDRASRLNIKL